MKRFLSLILGLSMSVVGFSSTAAVKNLCEKQKAEVKSVSQGDEEFSFCLFGEAMVGAETLSKASKSPEHTPEALNAFKKGSSGRISGGVCGSFGASLVEAKDDSGNNYNICKFSDGSLIEETTLWLGPDSLLGEKLNRVLAKMNAS